MQSDLFYGEIRLTKMTKIVILGALVAQWLALLTSDLEGPGSNPG
jgi:hypothetical protein